MSKAITTYVVDLGLLVAFGITAITGLIKFKPLSQLLGLNKLVLPMYQISVLHDWAGIVMVVFVLAHIVLHWGFLVGMTKSIFKKK